MRHVGQLFASIALIVFLAATTDPAFGQVRGNNKALTATIVAHIIDTAGVSIADVEVAVARSGDTAAIATAKTNKRGQVTVQRVPADGTPVVISARKIGYGPARGEAQLQAGDTLFVDIELPSLAVALAPITVTARRNRFGITAGEFNPKLYRDALTLLVQQRRDMLGDPERCPPPDSILGGPGRDNVQRFQVTDRLSFTNARDARQLRKRPWLDSLRYYSAIADPDLPYVQQVYVNGVRVDWPKVSTTVWMDTSKNKDGFNVPIQALRPVPGRSVIDELRRIPADQIAEIRYVDCLDQSVPFYKQYALYVTLKPPSREVQDSILRSLFKRSPGE